MLPLVVALLLGQLGSPAFEGPQPSAVSPSGNVAGCLTLASGCTLCGDGAGGATFTPVASDGGTVTVAGPLAVTSAATVHGVVSQALATPGAPTVTVQGTAGSTTDTYAIQATSDTAGLMATVDSATTSVTTANATLSSLNYNAISWTAVPGAQCYLVRRTAAGGTPSTTGVIATVCGGATAYSDQGAAGDGSANGSADYSGSLKQCSGAAYCVQTAIGPTGYTQHDTEIFTPGVLTFSPASSTTVFGGDLRSSSYTAAGTGVQLRSESNASGPMMEFGNIVATMTGHLLEIYSDSFVTLAAYVTASGTGTFLGGIQAGSSGSVVSTLVLGTCAMSSGTTCTVTDTGVSATSTILCSESGTTLTTPAAFTGATITAGTSYVVNASASNSGTWRCERIN